MTLNYQPRGVVLRLLAALRNEPEREFTAKECAEIMDCEPRAVGPFTDYARKHEMIYRRKEGRKCLFRASPYLAGEMFRPNSKVSPLRVVSKPPPVWTPDADDPRIAKVVPGWKPPVMVCVRNG
jgi:hypothetical protein